MPSAVLDDEPRRPLASPPARAAIRVFDAAGAIEAIRLAHPAKAHAVAISRDGSFVATGGKDGVARVFDARAGMELADLPHEGDVRAVALSADGMRLVTGCDDGSVRVFDGGVELGRVPYLRRVWSVALSADGAWVAAGAADGAVRVFEAATGRIRWNLQLGRPARVVAFSPDRAWLAAGGAECPVRLFDLEGTRPPVDVARRANVKSLGFSADGRRVAAGDWGSTRIYETSSRQQIARLRHRLVWASAIAFHPAGDLLAVCCTEPRAGHVFEIVTGRELARLSYSTADAAAFSPDATRVVVAGSGSVRVFGHSNSPIP